MEETCSKCNATFTKTGSNQKLCGSVRNKLGCSYQHSIEQKKAWNLSHPKENNERSTRHRLKKQAENRYKLYLALKSEYETQPPTIYRGIS